MFLGKDCISDVLFVYCPYFHGASIVYIPFL